MNNSVKFFLKNLIYKYNSFNTISAKIIIWKFQINISTEVLPDTWC